MISQRAITFITVKQQKTRIFILVSLNRIYLITFKAIEKFRKQPYY